MSERRIAAVDAARGIAMILVFLSHFGDAYFQRNGATGLASWSYRVSMIAAPTFMILSGMMLGLLYRMNRLDFARTRLWMLGRGLLLITFGHALIYVPHVFYAGGFLQAMQWGFMTDTIGFSVIIGSLLITLVRRKTRLIVGAAIYIGSTCLTLLWNPESQALCTLKDALVGQTYQNGIFGEFFAFLPWFALYFASSTLGEALATAKSEDREKTTARALYAIGVGAIVIAAVGILVARVLLAAGVAEVGGWLRILASPWGKRPPMPGYYLAYGGIGLTMLAVFLSYGGRPLLKSISGYVSVFGRASLATFVFQYFMYYGLFVVLSPPLSDWWPLYLVSSVVVLHALASAWDRRELNRILDVPYHYMVRRGYGTVQAS